ncbi:MAG: aspartyl protease family protein [Candidatus Melainabacteria bacterium]|nr:aspartyl protease family protein [Candidatus Melainabacteria bacterium]
MYEITLCRQAGSVLSAGLANVGCILIVRNASRILIISCCALVASLSQVAHARLTEASSTSGYLEDLVSLPNANGVVASRQLVGDVALVDKDKEWLSLEQLMNKIFLAYGGRDALARQETNVVVEGRQTTITAGMGAEARVFCRKSRKGNKLRIDLSSKDQLEAPTAVGTARVVSAYDGVLGWKRMDGQVVELSQEESKLLAHDNDHQPSVLSHWREPGYELSLIGRTSYRQIPVLALELTRTDEGSSTIFVDEKNYLVVGLTYKRRTVEKNKIVECSTDFSEYRPYGGTMVPFRQIEYLNGQAVQEFVIDDIRFDVVLADKIFSRPGQASPHRLAKPLTFPAEYTHGVIVVKVRVNGGEPLDFLFDTGASDTIVDRRTAAEHYLDKLGLVNIAAASEAVATQKSVIHKLEIGGLVLPDVPVLILSLSGQSRQLGRHVAGIIGTNILSQFAVTIDYGKPEVILEDALDYVMPPGARAVAFSQVDGPKVKAVLNGVDEQVFLVDTGAAFNHLPYSRAKKFIKGQPQYVTEGTGLDGRPVKLSMVSLDTVAVGSEMVKKVSFTYPYGQESDAQRGGFFEANDVGILGNPFLQNFVLTLDYRLSRLVLQANLAVESKQQLRQLLAAGDSKLVVHRDYRGAHEAFKKAAALSEAIKDLKEQARVLGRLGNLYRVMARDLKRTEQARTAYDYFSKAQAMARQAADRESEGHILADWSLLYSDNGQAREAKNMMDLALVLAPQDPQVNVDYAVHLYRAQQYSQMQKYVEKVLFLDPSNWQGLWYQVKLAEMSSNTPALLRTLKEILRFYPWSSLAKEKLNALKVPAPGQSPALKGGVSLQTD